MYIYLMTLMSIAGLLLLLLLFFNCSGQSEILGLMFTAVNSQDKM